LASTGLTSIILITKRIYFPKVYGSEIPLLPLETLGYAYVLIAGLLMPSPLFLHILSIIQV
jgi:hypothetical protein